MADDIEEEDDHTYGGAGATDNADLRSSGESDSEDEGTSDALKRSREEQLDLDEVEALKKDLGEDAREGKRIKGVPISANERKDVSSKDEAPSKESEEIWRSLQESKSGAAMPVVDETQEEMILVKNNYLFAGEEVKEEKLLPASHPDAIAYLASLKKQPVAASIKEMNSPKPLPAAPGPRKKKSSLAAMSAAATGKPVKINTLEKSKMDWNKFKEQTTDEREREEMEAQTKGGSSGLGSMKGYMDRKNFLDRVQDRLGEQR